MVFSYTFNSIADLKRDLRNDILKYAVEQEIKLNYANGELSEKLTAERNLRKKIQGEIEELKIKNTEDKKDEQLVIFQKNEIENLRKTINEILEIKEDTNSIFLNQLKERETRIKKLELELHKKTELENEFKYTVVKNIEEDFKIINSKNESEDIHAVENEEEILKSMKKNKKFNKNIENTKNKIKPKSFFTNLSFSDTSMN